MAAPHPSPFLSTERLELRRFTIHDLDRLVELDSDPEVMRHISRGQPTSRQRLETELFPRLLSWYEQGPHLGFWAAELKSTGEFIGWFHLRPDLLEPDYMELGYRLRRNFWGLGLATEMGRELVTRAENEWGYRRLSGRALQANHASQRVLEKCGLTRTGEFLYPESLLPGWTEFERQAVKYERIR